MNNKRVQILVTLWKFCIWGLVIFYEALLTLLYKANTGIRTFGFEYLKCTKVNYAKFNSVFSKILPQNPPVQTLKKGIHCNES